MNTIKRFFADETGLEMSEYAVAAALIIAVGVAAWTTLGSAITTKITELAVAVGS